MRLRGTLCSGLLCAALASQAIAAEEEPAPDACAACHVGLPEGSRARVTLRPEDVHRRRGVSCVSCHGGDAAAKTAEGAHSAESAFLGTPEGQAIVALCGGCHSDPDYMRDFSPSRHVDQFAKYSSSGHGRALAKGDDRAATCASCHGTHGILPVSDPRSPVFPLNVPATCGRCHADAAYMAGRNLPTDIVSKYVSSVHGKALLERGVRAAPACNGCHGSHSAAKPRPGSVGNVCGECHEEQAALFRGTHKRHVFDAGGAPECVVCHSQHDIAPTGDALVGLGPMSLCSRCHERPEDPGTRDAQRLAAAFSETAAQTADASRHLEAAQEHGLDLRQSHLRLAMAKRHVERARVLVHGFDAEPVLDQLERADQECCAARDSAVALVAEAHRRRWLGYGATAAMVLGSIAMFLCLWFKVRESQHDNDGNSAGPAGEPGRRTRETPGVSP